MVDDVNDSCLLPTDDVLHEVMPENFFFFFFFRQSTA
jgi:hypothetical protein